MPRQALRLGARVEPRLQERSSPKLNIKLVIEHIGMEQAESSTAAARKALHANTNGASPDYELPWFVILPKTHSFALTNIGSKSTALSS